MTARRPTPSADRIALVGFMGAGKSTVGSLLARRLGWEFIDTDAEIVRSAGKPIAEIFSDDGERAFRDLEAATIVAACRRRRVVIALGGGALESATVRRELWRRVRVVYLAASPTTLATRVARDPGAARPLWPAAGYPERLHAERMARYQAAHLTVATDVLEPEGVVDAIVERWRDWSENA